MNNCKEFVRDDLMVITAIPVADFNLGTYAWQLTPTIVRDYFSPTLYNSITIGQTAAEDGAALIPIRRTTGKAKDSESDSVAGRLHTVSVSCKADDRDGSVWDYLLALERTPSHLLLTFRDGSQGFVAATQDTYTCETERDGADTSVSFKIQNWMGIQLLVD